MQGPYNPAEIEPKWQKRWQEEDLYRAQDASDKKKEYLLVEFPYPSGNLHVGHWYAFAMPDILARFWRMKGKNVLFPIGFDAFGLPAENAALKRGLNPRTWTQENIEYMRTQLQSMGASFDWSREVQTIDPTYYKWTQWMFNQFLGKGLAYQGEREVNWCPVDKTVLANEQVIDGHCERCGSEVEKRSMVQWNLRITDYADRLVDDLDALDWPEQIKESQRNWIGRSEGAEIDFGLDLGKKYKYVILHGFQSAPDRPRWLWAKERLEELGHEVILPRLPNPDEPTEEGWVNTALAATTYDENTVLVGHSLGAVAALKVLEKLEKPIARLVTVGGFVSKNFKDNPRPFEKTFSWRFDGEKIRSNVKGITILHDPRDYAVSDAQVQELSDLLKTSITLGISNEPHFTGDAEPDVVMWLRPTIRVFTTRPDTLFGATYLVLAPEHPWLKLALEHKTVLTNNDEVEAYVRQAIKKKDIERTAEGKEKTGVELKGIKAINPATKEEIPVFVADYVLGHYGTGAIMAVPAHDERDASFAKKYGLRSRAVVIPNNISIFQSYLPGGLPEKGTQQYEQALSALSLKYLEHPMDLNGVLVNSDGFDGLSIEDAKQNITAQFGRPKKTYRLRDWVVSRQRYWGVPIPVIHCEKCGAVPVPDKDLPVLLPEIEDFLPRDDGKSPLAKATEWTNVSCPQCGGKGQRETDTLDTFVDSSWYFLRYTDPHNDQEFASKEKMREWMPIDLYSGGAEHTTMHLLYSRFWHKVLFDLGFVENSEPYGRRMNRGLIMGPDGQKMSKRWNNVIDPDEEVKKYGTDTVRMYLAFIGPFNEVGAYPWNPSGTAGMRRFLERVWRLQEKVGDRLHDLAHENQILLQETIRGVSEDIEKLKFNTAISKLMILLNGLEKEERISSLTFGIFLTLLAPFAPHIAEELYQSVCKGEKSIHVAAWPQFDNEVLAGKTAVIAVQINGKARSFVSVPPGASREEMEQAARADEKAAKWLDGKAIARTVVVPGRLINFVLAE